MIPLGARPRMGRIVSACWGELPERACSPAMLAVTISKHMSTILLVEDSEDFQLLAQQALKGTGIELKVANSLRDALSFVKPGVDPGVDLFILDLHLPDGSGIEFLQAVQTHEQARNRPVMLITAEGEVSTKILAFNLGADDYITKPVATSELRARIEGKLRKLERQAGQGSLLRRGQLTLEPGQLQATNVVDGRSVKLDLTAKEFKILYFLMQHEGKPRSRAEIVKAAWGEGIHLAARTVDSHICALRKKLGAAGSLIESVPGLGYRFYSEAAPAVNTVSPPSRAGGS